MNFLKAIPVVIFMGLNLLVIVAMNICAYTSVLPPQEYPHVAYWGLLFPVFLIANVLFILFWLIFKWKIVALPLLGMLVCAPSVRAYIPFNLSKEPPEGSLKVLSYNTMSFGKNTTVPLEENPIFQYIQKCDADIICLQEAMKVHTDKAAKLLKDIYPYNSLYLIADNYNACFSKYPILSSEKIDYPSKTNASYVYKVLVGEDTLLVVNNHLESYRLTSADKDDYKSIIKNYKNPEENDSEIKYLALVGKLAPVDSIRGMQADSIAAFVERNAGCYMIVCGDFNASPISYPHYRLTRYLDDAYTHSGNGPGVSYHNSGMYFRIDHILISPNMTAYKSTVDRSISASEHYPIYTYVKLEGNR
jgi:endonuclease/exonuclease/phosphatase family metal-dependent hydrolase